MSAHCSAGTCCVNKDKNRKLPMSDVLLSLSDKLTLCFVCVHRSNVLGRVFNLALSLFYFIKWTHQGACKCIVHTSL